jgi:chemotaxis protein methyltransferase CheR
MEPRVFRRLSEIAKDRAGISLRPGKETLVAARIGKRLRALRLDTPGEYLHYLEQDGTGEEIVHFLNVISTNYTSFFREADHFERLREEACAWLAEGRRNIRIWCSASATGEEPYSIAMVLREAMGPETQVSILATDISTQALDTARNGVYPAAALEQLPRPLLHRYFSVLQPGDAQQRQYQVTASLREMIVYKRLNLAHPPFPMRGPLDAVFCRNVMIYFEIAERSRLIAEAERLLSPGGLLFIGHAETLSGIQTSLTKVGVSVYQKPPQTPSVAPQPTLGSAR